MKNTITKKNTAARKNTMLVILDGFGISESEYGNAIAQAHTPHLDWLFSRFPNTTIGASGLAVGLPEGQMGNSEVGHLNIGAGRVVYQELTKITKEIEDGSFFENKALTGAVERAKQNGRALHLIGLLSDGGVHSHISHLFALLDLAKRHGLTDVYVHAVLDGRDVPPRCAEQYIKALEDYMKKTGVGRIATIAGRYYTMDRDARWERVVLSYDAMTLGEGRKAASALNALAAAYERGENDEFVQPTVIASENGAESGCAATPAAVVSDGDSVIFFNFRPDRARQITRAFVDSSFTGFARRQTLKDLCYVCMTQYDAEMPNVSVAFPPQSLNNTLGEYLSSLGLTQLRIAETEKYAHVTFFFNGGVETPNNGEDRILVPSPKVPTYDLQPEMSARAVTERVVEQIKKQTYDVIILNFANCDMVGHTGSMEATIRAVETVDSCVAYIIGALQENGGQMILTADHGNADCMLTEDGSVVTSHSLNPVPVIVLTNHDVSLRSGGVLADLAPTLLDLMGLPQPADMTGESLIVPVSSH